MSSTVKSAMSFEEFYETYFPRIYNYVYSCMLHRQDTEDVTAEIFETAWRHFSAYDESLASWSTWIGTIARHCVQNRFNKAHVRREIATSEVPEQEYHGEMDPDETSTLRHPDNQQVYRMLCRLSEEEREFLELRYGLDLDNKEIGKMLGISSEAVRMRYHRLLAKCLKLMDSEKNSEKS